MSETLLSESIWSDAKDQGICLQCFPNKRNLSCVSLGIQDKQSKCYLQRIYLWWKVFHLRVSETWNIFLAPSFTIELYQCLAFTFNKKCSFVSFHLFWIEQETSSNKPDTGQSQESHAKIFKRCRSSLMSVLFGFYHFLLPELKILLLSKLFVPTVGKN